MSIAIKEIVEHGNQEVNALENQLAASVTRLDTARAELSNLERARKSRLQAIERAHLQVQQCEQAQEQAIAYAKICADTPQHQPSIKAASETKRTVQTACKELERLESQAAEAEDVAQKREQELLELCTQYLDEQERLQAELRTASAARMQALEALGQAKYSTIMHTYQEMVARADEAHTALVQAQIALHDFYEQSVQELEQWPALRQEVQGLVPVDNATLRVIEAAISWVSTLTKDIPHVNDQRMRRQLSGGLCLWDLLVIPNTELLSPSGSNLQSLNWRLRRLEQALEEYRAELAQS